MKRIVGVFGAVLLFSLTGCATKGYVRTQVDPLADRLSKLEEKVARLGGMTDADKAAINQANGKAQQALDVANRTASEARNANAAADRADAAAMKAEKAAKDAEKAAMESQQMERKSEKIFKLEQKK